MPESPRNDHSPADSRPLWRQPLVLAAGGAALLVAMFVGLIIYSAEEFDARLDQREREKGAEPMQRLAELNPANEPPAPQPIQEGDPQANANSTSPVASVAKASPTLPAELDEVKPLTAPVATADREGAGASSSAEAGASDARNVAVTADALPSETRNMAGSESKATPGPPGMATGQTAEAPVVEKPLLKLDGGDGHARERRPVPRAAPSARASRYLLRTQDDRSRVVATGGGTAQSEKAVAAGLDWLARHQAADGHWGPDCLASREASLCDPAHPCDAAGRSYPPAQTGLALLAFQAGGNYWFNARDYSRHVERGLRWLVARQTDDGALAMPNSVEEDESDFSGPYTGDRQCWMYEHAIATFALADACATAAAAGVEPDEKIRQATVLAVRFIERQQHRDGGWRYTDNASETSDTSVTQWPMLALSAALDAGIDVDPQTLAAMMGFFSSRYDPEHGTTGYLSPGSLTIALTAAGILAEEFILHQTDSPLIERAAPLLAHEARRQWGTGEPDIEVLSGGDEYYNWYNGTLALFHVGGAPWLRWNAVVRDRLVWTQIRGDGCERGSWSPSSKIAEQGGRIYSTALAVLTLEVYYRYARIR